MSTSSQYAAFCDALREWQPLLEALAHPSPCPTRSSSSSVGTAIRWVRSHGYSQQERNKAQGSLYSRLWRLVPELLAFNVSIFTSQQDHEAAGTKRKRPATGNCMWMQTLPIVMQINILNFLSTEHSHFHAKDLELLSINLLSDSKEVFWLCRAAHELLSKVKATSQQIQEKEDILSPAVDGCKLPDWLQQHKGYRRVLPWFSFIASKVHNPSSQAGVHSGCDSDSRPWDVNESVNRDVSIASSLEHDVLDLQTACPSKDLSSIQRKEIPVIGSLNPSHKERIETKATSHREIFSEGNAGLVLSSGLHVLGQSLREKWLENQPTADDFSFLRESPDASVLLKLIKPWEMKDEVVLCMIETGIVQEDDFLWSAQVFSHCLLPKLILLEQPAARFVVMALLRAAKFHPRASIDAILVPLVLCSEGANTSQCDVINRTLKECLPVHHILSFLGKVLLQSRRQPLPFATPPLVAHDYLSRPLILTESFCSVLQNILSQSISLDEELIGGLVLACEAAVVKLRKSLKFSSFLLCLLSKYGSLLKLHKSSLHSTVEKIETFMTKSLLLKSSSL